MWSGMKEITSLEDLSERAAQSKKKKKKGQRQHGVMRRAGSVITCTLWSLTVTGQAVELLLKQTHSAFY